MGFLSKLFGEKYEDKTKEVCDIKKSVIDLSIVDQSAFISERFAVTDPELIRFLLKNNAKEATNRSVYSIWSWKEHESGIIRYAIIFNTAESNMLEFDKTPLISKKFRFWEKGHFTGDGCEFVDDPNWHEKNQAMK